MAVTNKMKELTSSTREKQKIRSKIAKLNILIQNEEQAQEKTYGQIGRLYVSEHGNERENGFEEMLDAVSAAEQKISDYKNQILTLYGIRRCPECKLDVPINATFCCYCGKLLPGLPPTPRVCPNPKCGAPAEEGNVFCTACGTRLDQSEIEIAAIEPIPEMKDSVCPKCGAKIIAGNLYCVECGSKL